jgi:hypothetical protein
MKSPSLLLLLVANAAAAAPPRDLQVVDCDDGEKELSLEVHLDANPEQTGWTLVCDGVDVWNVPTGSLQVQEVVVETACVSSATALCELKLFDSNEDGFDAEGWYSFTYGATTVAVSDFGQANSFSELQFCVGTECGQDPLEDGLEETEEIEVLECEDDEEMVAWDFLLDGKPEETGWNLICDGDASWNVPAGSYSGDSANSWVTQKMCVMKNVALCTLTLSDTAGDGLDEDGWYSLTFGAKTIAVASRGEDGEANTFSEASFCFGTECNKCVTPVLFEIELNDKPEETRFRLICDGQIMWDHGSFDESNVFDVFRKEECIDPAACCEISVYDDGNDGIYYGYFMLTIAGEIKFYYDGSQGGQEFSEWSLVFAGNQDGIVCNKEDANRR